MTTTPDIRSIIENQKPLGEEFQKIIDENLESLYMYTEDQEMAMQVGDIVMPRDYEKSKKPNILTISKRFADLAKIPWHDRHSVGNEKIGWICSCGVKDCYTQNPNLLNPIEVLKVMRAREDWHEFALRKLFMSEIEANWAVPQHYILNETGLLLREAVEFLKLKGGK